MKRRFALCVLAICLMLAGCGTVSEQGGLGQTEFASSEPMPGFDAQNKYAISRAMSFQESDSFFCGSSTLGDNLYYYDKETGISGILCADPSCSHDSSSCGAYIKRGATMFLYDGLRYWITDDYNTDGRDHVLWQGTIAGTDQKRVKTISFENIILPYQPQQYAIHRDALYFLGTADTVSGVTTGVRLTLMRSPLDDSEEFTTLFDQTYGAYVKADVRFAGDHAFLVVQTWTEAIANPPVDLAVYQIDLSSGKMETVYEKLGGACYDGFWVTEQEELYLLTRSAICKVEDGALVPAAARKHTEDAAYLMDGIAVSIYLEDDQRCIEIVDFSGNTIYDGKIFPAEISGMDGDPNAYKKYSMLIVGGDSDKLIIELSNFEAEESYVILLDLHNNLEPTLLWKAQ